MYWIYEPGLPWVIENPLNCEDQNSQGAKDGCMDVLSLRQKYHLFGILQLETEI